MGVTTREIAFETTGGQRARCGRCGKRVVTDIGADFDGRLGSADVCLNCDAAPEQHDWATRSAGLLAAVATVKAGRTS